MDSVPRTVQELRKVIKGLTEAVDTIRRETATDRALADSFRAIDLKLMTLRRLADVLEEQPKAN
jgi:hypothetical protein